MGTGFPLVNIKSIIVDELSRRPYIRTTTKEDDVAETSPQKVYNSRRVTAYLDDKDVRKFKRLAKKQKLTAGGLARRVILDFMASEASKARA